MFLNKSVLLATITPLPARIDSILAGIGTRTESLIPVGISARMEFHYISSINQPTLPLHQIFRLNQQKKILYLTY